MTTLANNESFLTLFLAAASEGHGWYIRLDIYGDHPISNVFLFHRHSNNVLALNIDVDKNK